MSAYAEAYTDRSASGDDILNTVTITVSGSNRVVVVGVASGQVGGVGYSPDSVTFDTLGTPVGMSVLSAESFLNIYYLTGIGAGTYNIDVVYTGIDLASGVIAVSMVAAHQTTPFSAVTTNSGSGALPTVTLGSITDWGWVLTFINLNRTGVISFTPGSGQQTRGNAGGICTDGFRCRVVLTDQTPSPTRVSGGTLGASMDWNAYSFEVLASSNLHVGTPTQIGTPTRVATPTRIAVPTHIPIV